MSNARARTIRGWIVSDAGKMHPQSTEVDAIRFAKLFLDHKEARLDRSFDSDEHVLPVKMVIYPVCESCGHRLVTKRKPPKPKAKTGAVASPKGAARSHKSPHPRTPT